MPYNRNRSRPKAFFNRGRIHPSHKDCRITVSTGRGDTNISIAEAQELVNDLFEAMRLAAEDLLDRQDRVAS
jgi:hypothetical protein